MSNIYIQEPPTHGKVLLSTSVGDIDLELWSKEAPKACRNFIQLCLEGYYDGTIFHRVVPEFIVQGGDPTGTGHGGESVYGKPFKDEFHSRLRFVRRGLVAMANSGPNDNGSQFFFTLGMTPELQNKHTIFGKVSGNTVYNMLKLQEVETDSNERPLFPHKINKTEVLSNPFDDIIPRVLKKTKVEEEGEKKPKSKSKATKNFSLLSFGEEAEEDEEETSKVSKDMKGKSKSSHDLAKDPRLSSVPAVSMEAREEGAKRKYHEEKEEEEEEDSEEEQRERDKRRDDVRKKLKKSEEEVAKKEESQKDMAKEKTSRSEELRAEAKKLKKELQDAKKRKEDQSVVKEQEEESPPENDAIAEYKRERQKYKEMRKQQGKKGSEREKLTLQMLAKFQNKLQMAKNLAQEYSDDEEESKKESETKEEEEEPEEEDQSDMSWMCHKLTFETEERKKKVIDANIQDLDRYDVYDPRNPLTKRRREASKQSMKGKR